MSGNRQEGFTLIELLIVIAIIGILAVVLIPNLLNARARAFDTAAQTCLREISTQEEVAALNAPFGYSGHIALSTLPGTSACVAEEIVLGSAAAASTTNEATGFQYWGHHPNGSSVYTVSNGTGVTRTGAAADGLPATATATY